MSAMAEGSYPVCLETPVESKLHFHKHLANLLKMLMGFGWPGLGQETPDELITMARRNGMSVCNGSVLAESGGGVAPQGNSQEEVNGGKAKRTAACHSI